MVAGSKWVAARRCLLSSQKCSSIVWRLTFWPWIVFVRVDNACLSLLKITCLNSLGTMLIALIRVPSSYFSFACSCRTLNGVCCGTQCNAVRTTPHCSACPGCTRLCTLGCVKLCDVNAGIHQYCLDDLSTVVRQCLLVCYLVDMILPCDIRPVDPPTVRPALRFSHQSLPVPGHCRVIEADFGGRPLSSDPPRLLHSRHRIISACQALVQPSPLVLRIG